MTIPGFSAEASLHSRGVSHLMSMPGLIAEASLSEWNATFEASATFNRIDNGVHPAQFVRARCYPSFELICRGFVDPSGYFHEFCFLEFNGIVCDD